MKYQNPIITGFYPDPSIVRVEDDYYLVNSSFEYFPGIPIFHSRDLINWKQIGHGISREGQLPLREGFPGETGTFAPTIRYHEGVFYIICTNVTYGGIGDGNFLIYSEHPDQGWSDPIYIDCPGIDPSLYFEQGRAFYTGTADGRIFLCEIDRKTGKRLEEIQTIWQGTGGNDPEGPHLYYENGWYYLLISEGGTEYGHMITIARSKSMKGPYESCPFNPVLTNRSTSKPIKAVGHADLVCDQNGKYWAVCLGIRPISYPFKHNLGRETMLTPVYFREDDWPVFGNNGFLEKEIETDILPVQEIIQESICNKYKFVDCFEEKELDFQWNFIYKKIQNAFVLSNPGLQLNATEEGIQSDKPKTWIGVRQKHHVFRAQIQLNYNPLFEDEETGIAIYLNHRHFYSLSIGKQKGKQGLIFHRQIGSLCHQEFYEMENFYGISTLYVEGNEQVYQFGIIKEDVATKIGEGETAYLTTEVGGKFTGNYIGIYGKSNQKKEYSNCLLHKFSYQEL